MEELLKELLLGNEGLGAYAAVFGILLACGVGLPLPEDVALILGGYLSHTGAAHVGVMIVVGYLGIAVGDSITFFAGRRLGSRVAGKPGGLWGRLITEQKRAQVGALFAKHGAKMVMVARFLPGLRAVAFFSAGNTGMPYWRFIFFDSVAALASAPLFVLLGWHFGGQVDALVARLKQGQLSAFAILGAIAAGWGLLTLWKRRRNRARNAAAAVEQA